MSWIRFNFSILHNADRYEEWYIIFNLHKSSIKCMDFNIARHNMKHRMRYL